MKKLSKFFFLSFFTFFFISCTGLFSPKGKILITLPGNEPLRAITGTVSTEPGFDSPADTVQTNDSVPQYYEQSDIEIYEIIVEGNNFEKTVRGNPGQTVSIENLNPGTYYVSVHGLLTENGEEIVAATGEGSGTVIAALPTTVKIKMTLLEKTTVQEPVKPEEPIDENELNSRSFMGLDRLDGVRATKYIFSLNEDQLVLSGDEELKSLSNGLFRCNAVFEDGKTYFFTPEELSQIPELNFFCQFPNTVGDGIPVDVTYKSNFNSFSDSININIRYKSVFPELKFLTPDGNSISSLSIPAFGSSQISFEKAEARQFNIYGKEETCGDTYSYGVMNDPAQKVLASNHGDFYSIYATDDLGNVSYSTTITQVLTVTQSDYAVYEPREQLKKIKELSVKVVPYSISTPKTDYGNYYSGELSDGNFTFSIVNSADAALSNLQEGYSFEWKVDSEELGTAFENKTDASSSPKNVKYAVNTSNLSSAVSFNLICSVKVPGTNAFEVSRPVTLSPAETSSFYSFEASISESGKTFEAEEKLSFSDFYFAFKDSNSEAANKPLDFDESTVSISVPTLNGVPYIGEVPVTITYKNGAKSISTTCRVSFIHTLQVPTSAYIKNSETGKEVTYDDTFPPGELPLSVTHDANLTEYALYGNSEVYTDKLEVKFTYMAGTNDSTASTLSIFDEGSYFIYAEVTASSPDMSVGNYIKVPSNTSFRTQNVQIKVEDPIVEISAYFMGSFSNPETFQPAVLSPTNANSSVNGSVISLNDFMIYGNKSSGNPVPYISSDLLTLYTGNFQASEMLGLNIPVKIYLTSNPEVSTVCYVDVLTYPTLPSFSVTKSDAKEYTFFVKAADREYYYFDAETEKAVSIKSNSLYYRYEIWGADGTSVFKSEKIPVASENPVTLNLFNKLSVSGSYTAKFYASGTNTNYEVFLNWETESETFEFNYEKPEVDGNAYSSWADLKSAVDNFVASANEGDTETFVISGNNISLSSPDDYIEISKNVDITIKAAGETLIDGDLFSGFPAFYIENGNLNLEGTDKSNFTVENFSDGVFFVTDSGSLNCKNITFRKNHNTSNGGVMSVEKNVEGQISFANCDFLNNFSDNTYGSISFSGDEEKNTSEGGAVYIKGTGYFTVDFTDCIFSGNHAGIRGGAICLSNTDSNKNYTCTLKNTKVYRNYIEKELPPNASTISHMQGAGISVMTGKLILESSTVIENYRKKGVLENFNTSTVINNPSGIIDKRFNDIYIHDNTSVPSVTFRGAENEYGTIICSISDFNHPTISVNSSFSWKTNDYTYGASLFAFYSLNPDSKNTYTTEGWKPDDKSLFNFMTEYEESPANGYSKPFQFLDLNSWEIKASDTITDSTPDMVFPCIVSYVADESSVLVCARKNPEAD